MAQKTFTLLLALTLAFSLSFGQGLKGGKVTGGKIVGTTASGGASDFVTDTFTEASGTPTFTSHVGELGATWTLHTPTNGTEASFIDSTNDRAYPTGDPQAFYASGTPPSANYTVCQDIQAVSDVTANIGPCGRMETGAATMYCARYNSGTSWQLRLINAGTGSTLTSSTNQLITVGQSKTLCLVMSGTTISMTVNGTTEGGAQTDSTISAAGKAGWRSAGTITSSTGYHIDNFSAR